MKEQDAAHPDFPQWIKTKDGLECMMWPITDEKYLYNRLSWAFDAGRNCVWDQYINQKAELTRLRSELQQERDRIRLFHQTLIARFYNDPTFNKDSLSKIIDEVGDLL